MGARKRLGKCVTCGQDGDEPCLDRRTTAPRPMLYPHPGRERHVIVKLTAQQRIDALMTKLNTRKDPTQ